MCGVEEEGPEMGTGIDKRLVVPILLCTIRYVLDENEQSNRHFPSNQRLVVLNEFVVEELHGLWDSSSLTRGRTQVLRCECGRS